MNPSVRELDDRERDGIKYATAWINDILERGFKSNERLSGTLSDIPTLHSVIEAGPYGDDAASELVLFSTAFGEVLATELSMQWVVITDASGAEFALQYQDLSIFVFPRDMIIKRVEAGEQADQIDLKLILDEVKRSVQEQIGSIGSNGT